MLVLRCYSFMFLLLLFCAQSTTLEFELELLELSNMDCSNTCGLSKDSLRVSYYCCHLFLKLQVDL